MKRLGDRMIKLFIFLMVVILVIDAAADLSRHEVLAKPAPGAERIHLAPFERTAP